jgi:hypothetical protein
MMITQNQAVVILNRRKILKIKQISPQVVMPQYSKLIQDFTDNSINLKLVISKSSFYFPFFRN